mmetsp:Transcript_9399/g.14344  ORF Transcript_9399/g.14344 Transcript_9399/m.14344 type:complete len:422 (+) Transcript_9399:935-2200(+)
MFSVERLFQGVKIGFGKEMAKHTPSPAHSPSKKFKKATARKIDPFEHYDEVSMGPPVDIETPTRTPSGISICAATSVEVMTLIVEFLMPMKKTRRPLVQGRWDVDSILPGIEVFKISMASKQLFFLMHQLLSPLKFNNYRKNHEMARFIGTLSSPPLIYNKFSPSKAQAAPEWLSEGWKTSGAILDEICLSAGLTLSYNTAIKDSKVSSASKKPAQKVKGVQTPLLREVEAQNFETKGFVQLKGIELQKMMLCDIDLLVANDETVRADVLKKSKNYYEIEEHITGIGRIIFYSSNRQVVVSFMEGQFAKGKLKGFGRVFSSLTLEESNLGEGCSVQVGFWEPIKTGESGLGSVLVNAPKGKWAWTYLHKPAGSKGPIQFLERSPSGVYLSRKYEEPKKKKQKKGSSDLQSTKVEVCPVIAC